LAIHQAERLQHVFEDVAEHCNFIGRKHALPSQDFVVWHGQPSDNSVSSDLLARKKSEFRAGAT
jgi:hypothetical protein